MKTSKRILSTLAGVALLSSGMARAIDVDVTSKTGITIGGAIGGAGGKFVPWGGSVVLSDSMAFLRSDGHCAFNVSYDMENLGSGATASFKNALLAKGATVAVNSGLALSAGQTKQVNTQAYLGEGAYDLQLKLDAENNLSESNENNNLVNIHVTLNGGCGGKPATSPTPTPPPPPPPKADLLSQKGISIGGKSVPWGGSIVVHAADAILVIGGQCAFNVGYDMANIGAASTSVPFSNQILSGTRLISQQSGLTLAKGASTLVHTQAYLSPGSNALTLLVDANHNVEESNEANNETKVTVLVDATCRPAGVVVPTTNRK